MKKDVVGCGEEVQAKFYEFRTSLNSFLKKDRLECGVSKEELDQFQIRLFEKMKPTRFTNSYLKWMPDDDIRLIQMHKLKVPISDMALELGRTKSSIKARIKSLPLEQLLENVPEFFGALSKQLKVDPEVLAEEVNSVFINKKFESLKKEIAERCLDTKTDFKIKPRKKKRKPGRPRNDEKHIVEFDGFIIEPKKPVGRPRKYQKAV